MATIIAGGYRRTCRHMCVCIPSHRTLRLCSSLGGRRGALLIHFVGSLAGLFVPCSSSPACRTRKQRMSTWTPPIHWIARTSSSFHDDEGAGCSVSSPSCLPLVHTHHKSKPDFGLGHVASLALWVDSMAVELIIQHRECAAWKRSEHRP